MSKSIGYFTDVSNLYYCIRRKYGDRKLDYGKYLEYLEALGDTAVCIAYGAQVGSQAKAFIKKLHKIGYTTKYKQPKTFFEKRKADWDVGITVDIIAMLDRLDIVIIGSADSDLAPLVEYVQARGKEVVIFASGISKDLRSIASNSIEIFESLLEDKP